MSCRTDSSSEANSSCSRRSDAILHITPSRRLLIYSKKSVGPRMKPLGTPALT